MTPSTIPRPIRCEIFINPENYDWLKSIEQSKNLTLSKIINALIELKRKEKSKV